MTTVEIIQIPNDDDWLKIRNDFLASKRKHSDVTPSSQLRLKYLFSEHSPLYGIMYAWEFHDLPYWISNQIVRSHEGFYPVVSSQRNDIQYEYDRRKAPQDALVNLRVTANPVAIMATSRKRLCLTASAETREIWGLFVQELNKYDPLLASLCVKPCVYKNTFCNEVFSDCKYYKTKKLQEELESYKNVISSLKG